VLRAVQPEGFLLENVWNLQYTGGGSWSKDEDTHVLGEDFKRVLQALDQAGYEVITQMLCASGWVPQKRQCIYFVGFRKDLAEKALAAFEWPVPPGGGGVVRDIMEPVDSEAAKLCELTQKQWAAVQNSSTWAKGGEQLRVARLDSLAQTLTSSYKSSYAQTSELVAPARGSTRPRFYSHRECARLMGFPESHDLGCYRSLNRRYTQLGDAVCPPLIHAIAWNLLTSLGLPVSSKSWLDAFPVRMVEQTMSHVGGYPSQGSQSGVVRTTAESVESTVAPICASTCLEFASEDVIVGTHPPLREQLNPLTVEDLERRIEAFGETVRQAAPEEFVNGFKVLRRAELLDVLCKAYAERAVTTPRAVVKSKGFVLSDAHTAPLLEAVRMMDWKKNARPGVQASGYAVLKNPGKPIQPSWRPTDQRVVRQRVLDVAEELLRAATPKSQAFQFTAIAVSKNFIGSPHIDNNDISVQYALSLGDFDDGGGELCVEESPFVVHAIETRRRLACIDGRFPHWVSSYRGERYSVIFYCTAGVHEPAVKAVHEV